MRFAVVVVVAALTSCASPSSSSSSSSSSSPSSSAPASAGFYGQLTALVNGPESFTTATKQRVLAQPPRPLTVGLAGVSFGMSMQQVIDVWGRPKEIWMQGDNKIQLSISYSTFEFTNDALVDISIHSSDLPELSVADGKVAMGKGCPDLKTIFPDSIVLPGDDEDIKSVALNGDVILTVQSMDQEIISIEIEREQ